MPTFQQELARMLWLQSEKKVSPDEPCKVVLPRLEAEKRVQNKAERTRLIKELDTPEAYSDWEAEWARWIDACGGHKPIAQDLMLRALRQYNEPMIAKLAADEESEKADADFAMGRETTEAE